MAVQFWAKLGQSLGQKGGGECHIVWNNVIVQYYLKVVCSTV